MARFLVLVVIAVGHPERAAGQNQTVTIEKSAHSQVGTFERARASCQDNPGNNPAPILEALRDCLPNACSSRQGLARWPSM